MTRFCASCGTEVDDTAVFCPTCGQPIDQQAEAALPPAPAWPDPAPADAPRAEEMGTSRPETPAPYAASGGWSEANGPEEALPPPAPPRPDLFDDRTAPPRYDGITGTSERVDAAGPLPQAAGGPVMSPPAPAAGPTGPAGSTGPTIDLPITTPVTLSAWLIGIGSLLGAVGAAVSLLDGFGAVIDLLVLIALAAVALSVFFAHNVPAVPHLRFVTLAVVLVAFGIGLDRLGFGGVGVGGLLLFLGTAAAAIGAVLLELGRDQPLGGPQR